MTIMLFDVRGVHKNRKLSKWKTWPRPGTRCWESMFRAEARQIRATRTESCDSVLLLGRLKDEP
jgi:hypothetical protein